MYNVAAGIQAEVKMFFLRYPVQPASGLGWRQEWISGCSVLLLAQVCMSKTWFVWLYCSRNVWSTLEVTLGEGHVLIVLAGYSWIADLILLGLILLPQQYSADTCLKPHPPINKLAVKSTEKCQPAVAKKRERWKWGPTRHDSYFLNPLRATEMALPVPTKTFYHVARTRPCCLHHLEAPTHLPLSRPFCSHSSQGHCWKCNYSLMTTFGAWALKGYIIVLKLAAVSRNVFVRQPIKPMASLEDEWHPILLWSRCSRKLTFRLYGPLSF